MDVTGVAPIRVRGMYLCANMGRVRVRRSVDLHPREICQDWGQSRYNWTSGAVEIEKDAVFTLSKTRNRLTPSRRRRLSSVIILWCRATIVRKVRQKLLKLIIGILLAKISFERDNIFLICLVFIHVLQFNVIHCQHALQFFYYSFYLCDFNFVFFTFLL